MQFHSPVNAHCSVDSRQPCLPARSSQPSSRCRCFPPYTRSQDCWFVGKQIDLGLQLHESVSSSSWFLEVCLRVSGWWFPHGDIHDTMRFRSAHCCVSYVEDAICSARHVQGPVWTSSRPLTSRQGFLCTTRVAVRQSRGHLDQASAAC